MKKVLIVLIWVLCYANSYAQVQTENRALTWSIGKVKIERGGQTVKLVYPLQVEINDPESTPQLGTSTIRFFYDAGYLEALQLESIANGYVVSGLNQSNDVFGEAFGFPGKGGVFTQFNIIANESNPIPLSTEPVHVLDIAFSVKPGARMISCIPIVLDNHSGGWGAGPERDFGYLPNEGGIISTYHLDGIMQEVFLANNEVRNYLWKPKAGLLNRTIRKKGDQVGEQLPARAVAASGCAEIMTDTDVVDMIGLQATGQGDDRVWLEWSTISEFDNDRFEIQRSLEGADFKTIGSIKGAWHASEETAYGFLDDQAHSGNLFYRIRQVSGAGKVSLSEVRMVTLYSGEKPTSALELSCFPNPTSGMLAVSYKKVGATSTDAALEILVFDATGHLVLRKQDVQPRSWIDLAEFSAGVYQVVLQNADQEIEGVQRIVLAKE